MCFETAFATSFFGFSFSRDQIVVAEAKRVFNYEEKLESLNPFYADDKLEDNERSNSFIARELYSHIIEEFLSTQANPISQLITLHAVLEMMELAVINADLNSSFVQDKDSKTWLWKRKKNSRGFMGKKKKATKRSEKSKSGEKTQIGEDDRVFVLKWNRTMELYQTFLETGSNISYQEREALKKLTLIYADDFVSSLDLVLRATAGGTETPYVVEARKKASLEAKDYLADYRNDTTSWGALWNAMREGSMFPDEFVRKAVQSKVTFLSFMFENKYILDMLNKVNYEISEFDELLNIRAARKILNSLEQVINTKEAKEFKTLFEIIITNFRNFLAQRNAEPIPVYNGKLLEEGKEDSTFKPKLEE